MKQLRITIETNLKNAQLKRERKASKRMLKAS